MTDVKIVSPEETADLLQAGYTYVDVRSEPEFEAGHVPGALNVPISHQGPAGMVPNPDFLRVMEGLFPKDAKLVVGCKMGGRSAKATATLKQAGFVELCDMSAGFEGKRDPFGRPVPGWKDGTREVETGAPSGRSYADVKARVGG
ncbi:MAG: rhodanese-like domain-containing protein [Myxococcales bacterium]|jgi:rhodanese-related sulfurtransferase|nr:rhodanese-like domain-containing protein [Myxococcales bacterium]